MDLTNISPGMAIDICKLLLADKIRRGKMSFEKVQKALLKGDKRENTSYRRLAPSGKRPG